MNPHNGPDNTNKTITTKVIAAIPIAGILAGAALLSGLLSVISGETAIAQQNMTGMNATGMNATGMNATGMNATGTSAIETLGGGG